MNYKRNGLNDSVYEDYSELESLRIENQLLKQLNNELQDKNRILNQLLTKENRATTTISRDSQKLQLTSNQKLKECQN